MTDFRRLVAALGPFSPYPRGVPPGLPFQWDVRTTAGRPKDYESIAELEILRELASKS